MKGFWEFWDDAPLLLKIVVALVAYGALGLALAFLFALGDSQQRTEERAAEARREAVIAACQADHSYVAIHALNGWVCIPGRPL